MSQDASDIESMSAMAIIAILSSAVFLSKTNLRINERRDADIPSHGLTYIFIFDIIIARALAQVNTRDDFCRANSVIVHNNPRLFCQYFHTWAARCEIIPEKAEACKYSYQTILIIRGYLNLPLQAF
jgi:hypothetical protein